MTPFALTAAFVTVTVIAWQGVSAPSRPTSSPSLPTSSLERRIESEVVAPMRERNLGRMAFSRAFIRLPDESLRAVVVDADGPASRWLSFRVESSLSKETTPPRVLWLGRIDRASGAIELARASDSPARPPTWCPAADVVGRRGR